MNRATLIGRLGKDPEVRRLNSGGQVVSFSLATSERWRDKNTGERRERTEWHNVVVFNENIGKIAEQYLKKGDQCCIEGQIQTREFTDKDGNQRRATEIVLQNFNGSLHLLGGNKQEGEGGERRSDSRSSAVRKADNEHGDRVRNEGFNSALDDDIPF